MGLFDFFFRKKPPSTPEETELERYVRLCNSSIQNFDKSSDIAIKLSELKLLERNLQELLRIAPENQAVRQVEHMIPALRHRVEVANTSTNYTEQISLSMPSHAVFHDYGIDMANVQKQARNSEKHLFQSANKKTDFDDDSWLAYCVEIKAAWRGGDFDFARQQLQQIAYSMVGTSVSEEKRTEFTQLMTQFAKIDPLYQEIIARVLPLVQANPGILQSQIYKGQTDHIKEEMRYVFYFANELGHIKRIKKGSSYELHPPIIKEMYGNQFVETKRENGVVSYETLPKYAGGFGATISATIDEETAELSREATKLKNAGDMDGAVQALKKVKYRTGTAGVRLPLFLQQAGRFDEAMTEFNILLSEVDAQYAKDFSHQPEFIQRGQALHAKATIYDKLRLACKRQKLYDEATKYQILRDDLREKFEAYNEVADKYQKNKATDCLI